MNFRVSIKTMKELTIKILLSVARAVLCIAKILRTICLIIFGVLATIIIIALLIVAALATAAEKFFALLASTISSLLAKLGNRFLGPIR